MEFYQASVLAGTVVLVAALASRAQLPAFLALLVGTLAFALFSRMTFPSIGDTFSLGFAQTLDSFGLFIVAGSIGTTLLTRAGIAGWPRHPGAGAAAAIGLVASLGPSAPAAMALLRPFCATGADARTRATVTVTIALALGAGQSFIFPSIFAVATRDILAVDLKLLLAVGIPLALVTAAVGALFVAWMTPRLVANSSEPMDVAATPREWRFVHALPVLVALILMTLATFAQIPSEPLGRGFKEFIVFASRPTVILLLVIGLTVMVIRRFDKDVMSDNGWIGDALTAAVRPLLAVAAAGGFIATIQATGMAELIAERISYLHIGILAPFLVALSLKLLQGSTLTATLTACTLIEPLLPALGLDSAWHRALAASAIGTGTLVAHINDPHFWLTADIADLKAARALALHSLGGLVQALLAAAILLAIA